MLQVLRFLVTNPGLYSAQDVARVAAGLAGEGWHANPTLPPGWLQRLRDQTHMIYLTPNYETLKSVKNVISYMKMKNYSTDTILAFKPSSSLHESGSPGQARAQERSVGEEHGPGGQQDDGGHSWEEGDHTLPPGWKMTGTGAEFRIRSPAGLVFSSRVAAFQHLAGAEAGGAGELAGLGAKLVFEDWHSNPLLPSGWRLSKVETAVHTLTGAGQLFTVVQAAKTRIRETGTELELRNFIVLMDALKPTNRDYESVSPPSALSKEKSKVKEKEKKSPIKSAAKIKTEPVETVSPAVVVKTEPGTGGGEAGRVKQEGGTEQLPPGWRWQQEEEGGEMVILNTEGKKFRTRREAVEFMIRNSMPAKQIYTLWAGLGAEGWALDSGRVPAGWRLRHHPALHDYKYLTREMQVVHSTEEAASMVATQPDFTQEERDRMRGWQEEVAARQPVLAWQEDPTLPAGWLSCPTTALEIIKSSSGARFEGRKEAIDFMIKEHCSPTDIFSVWSTLEREGWRAEPDQMLPTGWKRKLYPETGRWHYLSPMMEVWYCMFCCIF